MNAGRATSWRPWAALALLALAARLLPFVLIGPRHYAEHGYLYYEEMADNVLAGRGFHRAMPFGQGDKHAVRTPLYPLAIAGLKLLPGDTTGKVALLGALLGTASVLLSAHLARRTFGARAGWIAGAVAALWPHACVHDAAMQDTAMYSALMLGCIALALRLRDVAAARGAPWLALAWGLLAALAVLTRVTLVLPVVALVAWLALAVPRRRALAFLMALGLLAGLAPWVARNARVVGAPVLTTDAGRSLWLGNNPQTFSVYPRQSIDRSEERAWDALSPQQRDEVRSLAGDERAQDAWFRREAIAHVRAHPLAALSGFVRKAWAVVSPWMSPRAGALKQAVHLVTWTPVLALALVASWRHRSRWRDLLPLWIPAALLVLHSGAFFGHSAYRAYVDALAIVLASEPLARLAERIPRLGLAPAGALAALLALVVRLGVVVAGGDLALPADEWARGYETGAVARAVADGRGFADPFLARMPEGGGPPFFAATGSTAAVGPLMPAAWGGLIRAFGEERGWRLMALIVIASHAAVALLLPGLGALLGAPRAGRWAAIAWALHPAAVLAMGSPLRSVFPLLATWAIVEVVRLHREIAAGGGARWRAALRCGIALGASAWAEPLLLPFALAWAAVVALRHRRAAAPALVAAALALSIVAPWMARNARVIGTAAPRSWAGPELLLGATAGPGDPTPIRLHPTRNAQEMQRLLTLGEGAYVAVARERAMALVAERPARWVAACAWRWSAFWLGRASWWRPEDHPLLAGWPSALRGPLHAAVALAAIAGIVVIARRREPVLLPIVLLCALYPLPYALGHVEARYRLPIEPVLLACAAVALDASRRREHDARPPETTS